MKTLLITLACAAPLVAVRIAPTHVAGAEDGAGGDAQAESPLEERMEAIEAELGAIRRAIRDEATYPDALAAIARMEAATLAAKLLPPPMAATLPEADRPRFLRDYRKMMVDMVAAELALETALLDGDGEAIGAAFKALRAFEDAGHERFTRDE
jgi:hypothetical protein